MAAFDSRLATSYRDLSERLRDAAEFISQNRIAVATRSLRTLATDSRIPPATYSRLSQALGYKNFEQLREEMRLVLEERVNSFSDRARRLQSEHTGSGREMLDAHSSACIANMSALMSAIDTQALEETVNRLATATKVVVAGNLGSTGIAEYMVYQMSYVSRKWSMIGRMGASFASGLSDLDAGDALVVITKSPYARRSVAAAQLAQDQGVFVTIISDGPNCPAFRFADTAFSVPTETPNFFSSYAATLLLVEVMVGMIVARAGTEASSRIATIEENNRRLQEVWDG